MKLPLLIVLAILASLASVPVEEENCPARLTAEFVLSQDWRLFGNAYAQIPPDGFPIQFRTDGTVITSNLGRVQFWRIGDDGSLELMTKEEFLLYRFRRMQGECYLIHCGEPWHFELSCGGHDYSGRPSSYDWCRTHME